ncbi:metallophosphoesterase family protein [Salegentibacter chungangensis]|uniref:Metallophosphoesterase family protein n=1 Tax=Salegentibacter chungangensis TaxID=1335724 RepID=A0ABW3NQC6_9FLAO
MSRTIAIGDIHGGLKALIQLLERINISPEDQLIFLGDYVDGWSDSANVVSYLIRLSENVDCIFIRGNHDDLAHQWLETGKMNDQWLQHGGRATLEAYRKFKDEEIEQHLEFYRNMKNYHVDNSNRLFVHAGFTNLHGPEREYHDTGFYWDRTLWETAVSLNPEMENSHHFYPKRLQLFEEIFIGHTPVTRIGEEEPVQKANVWNVDTGAAFKGKLSAIEVKSKKIWQSEPVYQLYRGESGRN